MSSLEDNIKKLVEETTAGILYALKGHTPEARLARAKKVEKKLAPRLKAQASKGSWPDIEVKRKELAALPSKSPRKAPSGPSLTKESLVLRKQLLGALGRPRKAGMGISAIMLLMPAGTDKGKVLYALKSAVKDGVVVKEGLRKFTTYRRPFTPKG